MIAFDYVAATSVEEALRLRSEPGSDYLAGGTNLIDHLKLGIERPSKLIDVRRLGLDRIEETDSGLRIGAGVTNTQLANDPRVRLRLPALSQAILLGASPQLRNVATVAGNLLQRTRCTYFRDGVSACNKREPGTGCAALNGFNRGHALLGTSDKCIATHPSDMAVAMVAFDATILVQGPRGECRIPIGDFYVPYGDDPAMENVLDPGELITGVEVPFLPWFASSAYVKARDRSSFEFALASAAVAVEIEDGLVRDCRIALGGVATKPWRAFAAEDTLRGQVATEPSFRLAAETELRTAVPQKHNAFKIELCTRVIVKALIEAPGGAK